LDAKKRLLLSAVSAICRRFCLDIFGFFRYIYEMANIFCPQILVSPRRPWRGDFVFLILDFLRGKKKNHAATLQNVTNW
jgi:hypothetical protein